MSCRPCDFSQLEVFKGLQTQTNRLLKAFDIVLPQAVQDGAGQSVLWVDGRFGPKTTTAIVHAASKAEEKGFTIPADALVALVKAKPDPTNAASMGAVSSVAPELLTYFKAVADQIQAATPPSGIPTPEERGKKPEEEEIDERKKAPEDKSKWLWWVVGGTVLAGGAGFLGYYYWYRPRKMRALSGTDDDGDHDARPSLYGARDF